jgi:flagellar protein FlgJ
MTAISGVTRSSGAAPALPARSQLTQAAHQFEAVFLRQILAEARKTDFGSDLFSSDGIKTFREMMDSRLADVAAESGSLGLGKLIESQVERLLPKAKAP